MLDHYSWKTGKQTPILIFATGYNIFSKLVTIQNSPIFYVKFAMPKLLLRLVQTLENDTKPSDQKDLKFPDPFVLNFEFFLQ